MRHLGNIDENLFYYLITTKRFLALNVAFDCQNKKNMLYYAYEKD